MDRRDHISLTLELEELRAAIDGLRVFAGHLAVDGASTPDDEDTGTLGIPATLTLISERMRLLISAMRGNAEAKLVLAPHNRASAEPDAWEDGDVRFSSTQ